MAARALRASRGSGAEVLRGRLVLAPERAVQSERLVEIQRTRLLAAAVLTIDELGYTQATVGHITARAGVSRRTFYELFADREACLLAVLEDAAHRVAAELAATGPEALPWREWVRGGLFTMLAFLDREPALARVCVVQALRGGPAVLARREQMLARLAGALDKGRGERARGGQRGRLTAEGLVGAAFAIVHARLLREERQPLTGLLGELMAMIVLPYLGAAAARRELARPAPAVPVRALAAPAESERATEDPLRGVRMRLTYRTARVLGVVAARPGASNRAIAARAGVVDAGQISKLLARLERVGLLVNTGEGHAKGEPNAWRLTPRGELLVRHIGNVTKDACAAQGAGTLDSPEEG